MFVLNVFWGRRSFIDPICRNSCIVLSMFFEVGFGQFFIFSARHQLDVPAPISSRFLSPLPPDRPPILLSAPNQNRHATQATECADICHQSFLWLLRHTDELQRGRNSCLWLQSRSVLSSFGVVLMSCRVNFHVVHQHCSILLAEFNMSTFHFC